MVYAFLGAYFLLLIGIAIYSMRKSTTLKDFYLGGRNVGPWMSAFAYGAAYFSAVIFIGYAGRSGWTLGMSAVWVGIGNAILGNYIAWKVLARRTRALTGHLNAATMPEFFEKRFGSKGLRVLAAVIIFVFLVPYSASVYQGLGYLFEMTLNIPFIYCMLAMALVTAFYLLLGGYFGAALSDFIQGLVMLVGVVLMVFYIVTNPAVGGLSEGIARLKAIDPALVGPVGPDGPLSLISLILLTSLGSWGLPQMMHKFYAIRDERAIRRGTRISAGFSLVVAGGAYFCGVFGRLYLNNQLPVDPATGAANMDMIMPQVIVQALPQALIGIVLILVLSASMSTLASLVLVSSSAISMDLIKGKLFPNLSEKSVKRIMRVLCLVFVAVSFAIASGKVAAILTLMSFSWGTISGSFLGPFLYGLYWRRTTKQGAWAGMLAGLGTSVIAALATGFNAGLAPVIGVIAMGVSMVTVPVVSLLTKPMDSAFLTDIFTAMIPERKRKAAATPVAHQD